MYESQPREAVSGDIWSRYKATRDIGLRNSILMNYLHIVKINASRMSAVYRNHADLEDIVSQGIFVLLDCIEKYDPARGVKFDTFATIRVRGSIIDYMRKQDWVPRNLRKKAKDIEDTYYSMQTQLGRSVSDAEVAGQLGIGVSELNKVMGESSGFAVLSYEELLQEKTSPDGAPEEQTQEDEFKRMIAESIDRLQENERTVISLYYFDELKLREIAQVLNLTESRVSQIHSKALFKLKGMIREYMYE